MTNHILKHEGNTLGNLLKKVDQLNEFNRIFAQYLEPPIAAHCKVANVQNNCLIVIVDSGNWATQLRFHIPDLLAKLRAHPHMHALKSICCKTRPNPELDKPRKKRRVRTMKRICESAAIRTIEAADGIQDEKLRAIFKKIMERLEQ